MNAESTKARRSARWFPHPLTSVLLFVVWLWLNNSLAPGHLLLAALLAVVIPRFTARFWPEPVRVRRPLALLAYFGLVLRDVVVANLEVAALILGPASRWQPRFVNVPLRVRDDFVTTILASTVTLTPGTVSVDVQDDGSGGRTLLVHCLRCPDPEALIAQVRDRYEARLLEIFG
jgi:multicomponent K+:H+ antiporter subunit E